MTHRFAYLHGGPGFDSRSARVLLAPHLSDRGHVSAFWDEPSRLRPQGDVFESVRAYERWLVSAERFVLAVAADRPAHLLTHSFSIHAGLELARRHPAHIAGLVALAPATDAFTVYCSVLRIAERDFERSGDARGAAIRRYLQQTRNLMDEPMLQAFAVAAEDVHLLDHYWVNQTARQRAVDVYGGRFSVDVESFLAVLDDYRDRQHQFQSTAPVVQPVLAIFGQGDVVSPRDEHLPALVAAAPQTEVVTVAETGHYVHLEAPEACIELIEAWIRRTDPAVGEKTRNVR